MIDLLTAIQLKFADELLDTITGGIWLDQIPPLTAFPYCRVNAVAALPLSRTFGTAYIEPTAFQFSIFAAGNNADGKCNALVLAESLASTFDNLALTVGSATLVARREAAIQMKGDPANDEQGRPVYMAWMIYNFVAHRAFPR